MALTPIDIQQKTFGPELRGYNMDEVDDFLDEVVSALKDYDQRVRDSQDRIRALEAELSTRGEDESAISRALVAAQKQADAVVAEALAEAQRIKGEAQGAADQLRAEREAERVGLTQDIARMRSTVADLKRRVVELAASAGADLDEMDSAASVASQEVDRDEFDSDDDNDVGDYEQAAVGEGLAPFGDAAFSAGGEEAEVGESPEVVHVTDEAEVEEAAVDLAADELEEAEVGEDEDLDEAEDDTGDDLGDEWPSDAAEDDEDSPDVPAGEEESRSAGHGQHLSSDVDEEGDTDEGSTLPPTARRPWERGSI